MSQNHNNIYNILGKLASLTPKEEPAKQEPQKIYESVEARGSMLEGVSAVEQKLTSQFQNFAESTEVCNECGMCESDCECDHDTVDEGETTRKDGVTRHIKTDYPGYASDDNEESDDEREKKGKRGRPRKAVTKKPRPTGEKKGRGRPKKDAEPFTTKSSKDAGKKLQDIFIGKKPKHDEPGRKIKGKAMSGSLEEKAVSQAQQKFMGMVHSAQTGHKPASPAVAKVARTMGKRDARDFAATKHKGLPQHVRESRLTESFKHMADKHSLTMDEMLECLSNDIKMYQESGNISDRLRDCMEVHGHHKSMEEAIAPQPSPTDIKFATPAYQRKAAAQPGDNSWMINQQDFDQKEREMPTTSAGLAQRKQDLGLEEELNELARLAGIADEGNAFTGKLKSTPKGGNFELDGKTYKDTSNLDEEPNEGNAFTGKLKDTPKGGSFELDGKSYKDTSDLDEANAPVTKPTVKPVNGPKVKYGTIKQITKQGDDLNKPKRQDPATANKAANPLTLEDRLAAEYDSIKKAK